MTRSKDSEQSKPVIKPFHFTDKKSGITYNGTITVYDDGTQKTALDDGVFIEDELEDETDKADEKSKGLK